MREIILCIDDEQMVVDALKMELMSGLSGEYVIETAICGEEALLIADESIKNGDQILLIISDQKMPGMTGESLLSELNIKLPLALKILLTGYTDIEAVQYAINHAGLYRYIQKPWDRDDLILTVREAIEKYHTQRELERKTLQIIQMNEELERTVEIRTQQLSDAIKELESFTYTVSHDLKSPLRTIDYYTKFILEDYNSELNDKVIYTLTDIRNVCSNMFTLIDKLLQYALAAKTEPDYSFVDMGELFRHSYQEIASTEQDRNIDWQLASNFPQVKGDPVLLKQAVMNLLSNAVKFTRGREKAVIKITCAEEADSLRFSVSDNGAGFDMQYASKLFGIFQRMHSQSEFEGSGIGLATVKKIIEKHGGNVYIESTENQGTTLSFTLPQNS